MCQDKWSDWINKDSPTVGDGDREMLSPAELKAFCGNGKIKTIECVTTTGIASYSTGEIAMCSIEGGSVCLNADNAPFPCSDYKIRYFCECAGEFILDHLTYLYAIFRLPMTIAVDWDVNQQNKQTNMPL